MLGGVALRPACGGVAGQEPSFVPLVKERAASFHNRVSQLKGQALFPVHYYWGSKCCTSSSCSPLLPSYYYQQPSLPSV